MEYVSLKFIIGLISSKKYWRVVKNLVHVLKGVIQIRFYFYKILTKIQTKEERCNFLKTSETRLRENFDFRGLCVTLS